MSPMSNAAALLRKKIKASRFFPIIWNQKHNLFWVDFLRQSFETADEKNAVGKE